LDFLPNRQEKKPKEGARFTSPSGSPARRGRGRTLRNSPAWQQAQTVAASFSAVSPMLSLVKRGGERRGSIKADNSSDIDSG